MLEVIRGRFVESGGVRMTPIAGPQVDDVFEVFQAFCMRAVVGGGQKCSADLRGRVSAAGG